MSFWKEKYQLHKATKNGPLAGRYLWPPNTGTLSIPMESSPPCSGQASFCSGGCGKQGSIKIVLRASVEVDWLSPTHLGRLGHVSASSHTSWAWCPGIAPCSLPALWILIEYELLAVSQGVSSVRSAVPLPILPFRTWIERTIGSERGWTAATLDNIRKSLL